MESQDNIGWRELEGTSWNSLLGTFSSWDLLRGQFDYVATHSNDRGSLSHVQAKISDFWLYNLQPKFKSIYLTVTTIIKMLQMRNLSLENP